MGILLDLFTKMSSHYNTSVIHITQNLFHKGSGKHSSDHVGVYRNSHITMLFNNPPQQSSVVDRSCMASEEMIGRSLSNAGGNCRETQICGYSRGNGLALKAALHD